MFISHRSRIFIVGLGCFISGAGIPASAVSPEFTYEVIDEQHPGHAAIADIDNDGKNDVVSGRFGPHYDNGTRGIVWFQYPDWTKYRIAAFNYVSDDVVAADIDNDGDIDVLGFEKSSGGWNILWYENPLPAASPTQETSWESHPVGTATIEDCKDVSCADMNNDDKVDIVVRGIHKTYIFTQQSKDSWQNAKTISHHKKEGMEVADIDRDGDIDIVLNGFWLENPGDPSGSWNEHTIDDFWFTQDNGTWWDNNSVVAIAHINDDSYLDVAFSHSGGEGFPIVWCEAPEDPTQSWTRHVIKDVFDWCQTLQAADMDGDGDIDIVGAVSGGYKGGEEDISVFLNEGDGSSWTEHVIAKNGGYSLVVGDIDNDNDMDIVGERGHHKSPTKLYRNNLDPSPNKIGRRDLISPRRQEKTDMPLYYRDENTLTVRVSNIDTKLIELFNLAGMKINCQRYRGNERITLYRPSFFGKKSMILRLQQDKYLVVPPVSSIQLIPLR